METGDGVSTRILRRCPIALPGPHMPALIDRRLAVDQGSAGDSGHPVLRVVLYVLRGVLALGLHVLG